MPLFQILVMSDESRLGREMIEVGWWLKQILIVGIRVSYYLEDRERTLDSATDMSARYHAFATTPGEAGLQQQARIEIGGTPASSGRRQRGAISPACG